MADYLEDIKKDHTDNFDDILKQCKNTSFPSVVYAAEFRMHCIEKGFQDLGFSPQELMTSSTTPETAMDLIDQAMVSRNIKVEDWAHHEDRERRGLYIYKDNEIAYFVSLRRMKGDSCIVQTNVNFE
jgi:hypothetical protein